MSDTESPTKKQKHEIITQYPSDDIEPLLKKIDEFVSRRMKIINDENDMLKLKEYYSNLCNDIISISDNFTSLQTMRKKTLKKIQKICDHKWTMHVEYHNERYYECEKCSLVVSHI